MDRLRIRLYDVRFGDAILVSIPDKDDNNDPLTRHILIDVGNVLSSAGGQDELFVRVMRDVEQQLEGRPLDLYIMTHEHMDHVQGLLYAAKRDDPILLRVDTAWLSGSAAPDYYDTHDQARKNLVISRQMLDAIEHRLGNDPIEPAMQALIENNNYRKTADCVEFLRQLAATTHYIDREFDTRGKHPFNRVQFEIWAPEENTADYYGRFKPMSFGLNTSVASASENPQKAPTPTPPGGVDTGAFYNLLGLREGGLMANALTIDKAKNNSSVVFTLTWNGHVLLFSGDAETRSWRTMYREGALKPVDFIKVSHHGSHNGTPAGNILDAILPMDPGSVSGRVAAISTFENTYNNVPHDPTLEELARRCETVVSTRDNPGGFVDVFFD